MSGSSKAIALSLMMATPLLGAQREYIVATTVNVTTGVDNRPQSQVPNFSRPPLAATYGGFPSLSLSSQNSRSSLGLSYSYGYNRVELDPPVTNQSHSASAAYSTQMGRRWSISLSDSFQNTQDAATYNALRGVSVAATNATTLFYPVASRITTRSNLAGLNLARTLGPRASLALIANYSRRNYVGTSLVTGGSLSDQQGATAGVTFKRSFGPTDSLDFGVNGRYNQFEDFEDSRSADGHVTYSTVIDRSWRVLLGGGVSYVRSVGAFGDYTGVNASASVGRDLEAGTFLIRYNRDTGQQSGLGSTSNTQRFAASWSQSLSRVSTLFIDGNMFDSQGILDNSLNSRGYSIAANVGYNLSPKWSLHFGGQFQEYTEPVELAFTQKQLFVSLRYTEPRLFGFLW